MPEKTRVLLINLPAPNWAPIGLVGFGANDRPTKLYGHRRISLGNLQQSTQPAKGTGLRSVPLPLDKMAGGTKHSRISIAILRWDDRDYEGVMDEFIMGLDMGWAWDQVAKAILWKKYQDGTWIYSTIMIQ